MRFLFVGDCNSFLLQRLATELKKKVSDLEIDIITKQYPPTEEAIQAFDKIGDVTNGGRWNSQPKLKFFNIYRIYKSQLKVMPNNYDCCYFLYVSPVLSLMIKSIRSKTKYTNAVVFGSEFYRVGWLMKKLLKRTLQNSDKIGATNPQTLKALQDYFRLSPSKLKITRFGLSILDEMDLVTDIERVEFKKNYRIEQKKTIALGYNSSPQQGYHELIQSFKASSQDWSDFVFFFQFPDYKSNNQCKEWLISMEEGGFNCRVIEGYLSDRELAVVRSTLDIMVQVQTTDQLSGAMQEYLYGGVKVITGNWFPYGIFDDAGVQYWKVANRNEIPELIHNISSIEVNLSHNKVVIGNLSKWEQCISSWIIPSNG